MQVEIKVQEDDNFKISSKEEKPVETDVLVGRTWYRWLGEYLTDDEYNEVCLKQERKEEEDKKKALQRLLERNNIAEQPQTPKVTERRQPTLENPKGHEWFNGTSWGVK